MNKKVFCISVIFCSFMLFLNCNYAISNIPLTNITEENKEELITYQLLQKKDTLKGINECISKIKKTLQDIDLRLKEIKAMPEYKMYPAIRLNVETPVFGITSVVNQKLKISNDVSTADFASGYSIRDIIRKNEIKLPSFSVGNVIVVTRDVILDEHISLSDATTALLSLMKYLDQVNSVKEFLDDQINNIFAGYINQGKLDNIKSTKIKLDDVTKKLLEIDEDIIKLHLFQIQNGSYDSFLKEYNGYIKKTYQYKEASKNLLISDSKLAEIVKDTEEITKNISDFDKRLKENIELTKDSIDLKSVLFGIKEELEQKKDLVEKYISDSIKKELDNEENVIVYQVKSTDTLKYMNEQIGIINDKIIKYMQVENISIEDSKNMNLKERKIYIKEEKEDVINEIIYIYNNFINKEVKFYMDNLNYMLSDTVIKISDISKYTNKNVLSEMGYIFLELPDLLENYLKNVNLNSNIQAQNFTNDIYKELVKVVNSNIKVTSIYNENNTKELIKNNIDKT